MRRWADSIEERTLNNPGTGNLVLDGATVGNRPFSAVEGITNGDEVDYRVQTATLSAWEIGSATYHSSTNTLSRDTVFTNSLGTTAKVNLTGVCIVFLSFLSRRIVTTTTSSSCCYPLVTGALPGPDPIADGFGQYIMVPSP